MGAIVSDTIKAVRGNHMKKLTQRFSDSLHSPVMQNWIDIGIAVVIFVVVPIAVFCIIFNSLSFAHRLSF